MSLLEKIIDFKNKFHLTLLAVSVSDFNSISQRGIDRYFGKSGPSKGVESQVKVSADLKEKCCLESSIPSKNLSSCILEEPESSPRNSKRPGPPILPKGWDAEVFQR